MRCIILAVAAAALLGDRPVHAAATEERPSAGLFDTVRPTAEILGSAELQNRTGWQRVAEGSVAHRFRGDAVLWNRRIAVVLRWQTPGAVVYSHSPAGWKRQAILVPCGPQRAEKPISIFSRSSTRRSSD